MKPINLPLFKLFLSCCVLFLPLPSLTAQELPDFIEQEDLADIEAAMYRPAIPDSLQPKVKKGTVSADYNRAGLTIINLRGKGGKHTKPFETVLDSVQIPYKYDNNHVDVWSLQSTMHDTTIKKAKGFSVERGFFKNLFSKKNPEFFYDDPIGNALAEGLQNSDVPSQIYEHWFELDRNSNTMGIGVLQKRAAYNATDADIKMAEAMQRGINHVLDQGEKLVNSSYILLMHYHSIQDEKEYAAAMRAMGREPHNGLDRGKGFTGQASGYLFKLNFNDSVKQVFYQELWPLEDEPALVRKLRVQAFDRREFPVEFVGQITKSVAAWEMTMSQAMKYKSTGKRVTRSKEELVNSFAMTGLNAVIHDFETLFEPFQTKTTIFSGKPILAKIGTKESVRPDERFFVWEFREKKDGTTFARRKGVVRATNKIYDNSRLGTPCDSCRNGFYTIADSTWSSKFYQVAGKKLQTGMLMQQKNDIGISATLGYAYGGVGGPFLRVEYNTAQLIGMFSKKSILGMKIFIGGGLDFKQYDKGLITQFGSEAGKAPEGQSFFNIHGGLSKEFYFLRNYSAGVEFGFGYEGASWKDSDYSFGTMMLLPGFTLSGNIIHNLQVVLGGKWVVTEIFTPAGTTDTGAEVTFQKGIKWGDVYDGGWFKKRTGPQITLGIRYNY